MPRCRWGNHRWEFFYMFDKLENFYFLEQREFTSFHLTVAVESMYLNASTQPCGMSSHAGHMHLPWHKFIIVRPQRKTSLLP